MPFCVLLQIAVMLPHHHHGGTELACINPFHCLGHSHDHNDAEWPGVPDPDHDVMCCSHTQHSSCEAEGGGHRHDADGECGLSYIDFIVPGKEQNIIPFVIDLGILPSLALFVPAEASGYSSRIQETCRDPYSVVPEQASHTVYITRALPARAPSFLL